MPGREGRLEGRARHGVDAPPVPRTCGLHRPDGHSTGHHRPEPAHPIWHAVVRSLPNPSPRTLTDPLARPGPWERRMLREGWGVAEGLGGEGMQAVVAGVGKTISRRMWRGAGWGLRIRKG